MRFLRIAAAPLAVAVLSLAALPAQAATTRIGAVEEIAAKAPGGTPGGQVVQLGERPGTRSYAVPPGFGVITSWSHRTGPSSGPLTFHVYRATGKPGEFLTVAADPRMVTAGTTHVFPVAIRVKPGDRLGLSTVDKEDVEDTVNVAYFTEAGDQLAFFPLGQPEPTAGATVQVAEGTAELRVAVSAVVETDGDGDGRGDDSQDNDDDNDGIPDPADYTLAVPPSAGLDFDGDGISDANEAKLGTDPRDRDSDDDGLADGREDRNRDGVKGRRETSALRRDTDRDRLTDGLERGVRRRVPDPPGPAVGTDRKRFKRDRDPRTRTKPLRRDSDRDRLSDGREDRNRNGRRDRGETDPRRRDTDGDRASDKRDSRPLSRRRR